MILHTWRAYKRHRIIYAYPESERENGTTRFCRFIYYTRIGIICGGRDDVTSVHKTGFFLFL